MAQTYKICTLPGDGIGPEIIAEGVKVLNAIGEKYEATFECTDALIGGCGWWTEMGYHRSRKASS